RLQLNQGLEIDSSTKRSPGLPIHQPTSQGASTSLGHQRRILRRPCVCEQYQAEATP
ncbi:hypothetical protein BHE74_00019343, partial [Ensete ventricosum]